MDTDRGTAIDPLDAQVEFLTPALRPDLLERWNEPQRRYHNETHLRAVLRAAAALEADGEAFDGTAVRLAAWLHTAVFDPTESENNDKSAVFTERVLDPANNSLYASFITFLEGVVKKDDSTVTIKLKQRFSLVAVRISVVKIVPKAAAHAEPQRIGRTRHR